MNTARSRALGAAGRWLDPALAFADRVGLRAVWIGGAILLASATLVSVDVTIRKLFSLSIGGADEISGYAFAIGIAWAFPFALLRRAGWPSLRCSSACMDGFRQRLTTVRTRTGPMGFA